MTINIKYQKGYTLIELLAVMVVFVVIGGIVLAIIFSTLRATNKANTLAYLRQNGNYAISQMVKMIRDAEKFEGVKINSGDSYRLSCQTQDYHFLKITSFDGGTTEFTCLPINLPSLPNGQISSTSALLALPALLIDTSMISVTTCSFTCSHTSASDSPIIGISFSLSQGSDSPFVEKKASIDFETSVTMRNLNK